MSISTTTVTGPIYLASCGIPQQASVVFELSSFDTTNTGEAFVSGPFTAPLDASGDFSIDLFANSEGTNNTVYRVHVVHFTNGKYIRSYLGTMFLQANTVTSLADVNFVNEFEPETFDVLAELRAFRTASDTFVTDFSYNATDNSLTITLNNNDSKTVILPASSGGGGTTTLINSNTNLNSLTDTGQYVNPVSYNGTQQGTAAGGRNYPSPYGGVLVVAGADGSVTTDGSLKLVQTYYSRSTNGIDEIFTRRTSGYNIWDNWVQIATEKYPFLNKDARSTQKITGHLILDQIPQTGTAKLDLLGGTSSDYIVRLSAQNYYGGSYVSEDPAYSKLEFMNHADFVITPTGDRQAIDNDRDSTNSWTPPLVFSISRLTGGPEVNGQPLLSTVTKSDVGLSNVDNTSDLDKPISTATQTAITNSLDRANHTGSQTASTINDFDTSVDSRITLLKGTANGLATLDPSGTVPASQLPSYVDDIIEHPTAADFPATGESGKIYVSVDNNQQHRWAGSGYVPMASGGVSQHSQLILDDGSNPHATTKTDVGLGNVDNTADISKPLSNAAVTALSSKADTSSLGAVATSNDYNDLDNKPAAGNAPVDSVNNKTGVVVLDKTDIGLSNVNNTSDANKPVSNATLNALSGKANTSSLGTVATSNSYNDLDNLPAIPPAAPVDSVNNKTGTVVINKSDIGLPNVNNTSDIDKPISTATQTALDNKLDSSTVTSSNTTGKTIGTVGNLTFRETVTELVQPTIVGNTLHIKLKNENGITQDLSVNLPTSTQDVHVSGTNYDAASNVITITNSDNSTYSIDLSEFSIVQTTDANGITTLTQEGQSKLVVSAVGQSGNYSDLLGKPTIPTPPVDSVNSKTGAVVLNKTDLNLGNVDNTSDLDKPLSNATATALNAKVDQVNLSTVGSSNDYNDLDNKPTIPSPAPVNSVNSKTGNVVLDQSDIGLDNVDNTSDSAKPISAATSSALATKVDKSSVTVANTIGKTIGSINGSDFKETITELLAPTVSGQVVTIKFKSENGAVQQQTFTVPTPAQDIHTTGMTYDAASNTLTVSKSDNTSHSIDLGEFSLIPSTDSQGITTVNQENTLKFTLSNVGQTGDYGDLLNKPTVSSNISSSSTVNLANSAAVKTVNDKVNLLPTKTGDNDWTGKNRLNFNQPSYGTDISGGIVMRDYSAPTAKNGICAYLENSTLTIRGAGVNGSTLGGPFNGLRLVVGGVNRDVYHTGNLNKSVIDALNVNADTLDGKYLSEVTQSIDAILLNNSDDLNSLPSNGWYKWGDTAPLNSLSSYGFLLNIADGGQPQQLMQSFGGVSNKVRLMGRRKSFGVWDTWTEFWSDKNDGTGSGLDADMLDGIQASSFLRSDTSDVMIYNTINGEILRFANNTVGGKIQIGFQQNDSDGMHHRAYLRAWKGSSHASGNLDLIARGDGGSTTSDVLSLKSGDANLTWRNQTIWNAGNDGSGSGLDADLIHGKSGYEFIFWNGGGVIKQVISTPPASPSNGEAWLIGSEIYTTNTPSGAFAGKEHQIAYYLNNQWNYIIAKENSVIFNENTNFRIVKTATDWVNLSKVDLDLIAASFWAGGGVVNGRENSPVAYAEDGYAVISGYNATGAWSTYYEDIVVHQNGIWYKIPTYVGDRVYDESAGSFLRKNGDGDFYADESFWHNGSYEAIRTLFFSHGAVRGTANSPTNAGGNMKAWIVGSSPSGAFAGQNPRHIAYSYEYLPWRFVPPKDGDKVFDMSTGNTLYYQNYAWNTSWTNV